MYGDILWERKEGSVILKFFLFPIRRGTYINFRVCLYKIVLTTGIMWVFSMFPFSGEYGLWIFQLLVCIGNFKSLFSPCICHKKCSKATGKIKL
jgi:hypothetical protein